MDRMPANVDILNVLSNFGITESNQFMLSQTLKKLKQESYQQQ